MIRLVACLLLATGLTSMGLGATRLAVEHFSPHPQTFAADPRGTEYHTVEPRCFHIDPKKLASGGYLTYYNEAAAQKSGRKPHSCVKGQ